MNEPTPTIRVHRAANCKKCGQAHNVVASEYGAICLICPIVSGGVQEWYCGQCFLAAIRDLPSPKQNRTRLHIIDEPPGPTDGTPSPS
jgi:hypothetical protein